MRHLSAVVVFFAANAFAADPEPTTPGEGTLTQAEQALLTVPRPPWPAGDQRGMGNTQGYGTRLRCVPHLADPTSREYELSHVRSETMPMSPFAAPLQYDYEPTFGPPFSRHAVNGETISGEPGGQGTQIDALGHFGVLPSIWDPATGPIPSQNAVYYSGYTQAQVKPTPDSPLLKLGIEKMPPIVTSAVLLDARTFVGGGTRLSGGQRITAAHIQGMIQAQGLGWRGILPGDAVYIYTGWQELWQDPDTTGAYYSQGPGLSVDAIKYLGDKAIVAVGLDVPFIDPVNPGQLSGQAPPPAGTPPGLPFFSHHYALSQVGVHLIENMRLAKMATDKVWLSCTMVLALRERGGSGSPIRPVAYGSPQ
ncbi:MAG TPA: cyclase family protein [Archangium sp.]|jgi:kynurenine formamidase|uniref:cyclase family protein n=1 Tax=Archangium sp. TaxID=1872627 RepID=UPI002ED960C8